MNADKTRQNSTKRRSLYVINEHLESNFNAILNSAIVFQQPVKDFMAKVARLFEVKGEELSGPSKRPQRVKALSLLSCRAAREFEMSTTAVADHLGMTQSAISKVIQRGEYKQELNNKNSQFRARSAKQPTAQNDVPQHEIAIWIQRIK